jgi:peptidoglycan/LPS O-acetylase OafA/YrhL
VSEGLAGRNNSLGLIRLVLASAVIVSHAFPLGGWGDDPLLAHSRGQENIGGVAVIGFFAISGYLITKSGGRGDVVRFLWHRFLRIFPAYWLALLVGAFIVGPIVWLATTGHISGYLSAAPVSPMAYVLDNASLSIAHWGIGDIFSSTPYGQLVGGSVFNGSLWTLTYEWSCYLVIAALVLIPVLSNPKVARIVLPILTLALAVIQAGKVFFGINLTQQLWFLDDALRTRLMFAFLVGATIAVYSKSIRIDDRLAIIAAFVGFLTLWKGGLQLFGYPAIAYFLLWLAARLPARFRKIGAKNDYSYGIYVYGFLVEQFLAFLGLYHWGYLPYVIASLVVTAGLAWCSWHLVEKRALQLKDWGPGAGVRHWVVVVAGLFKRRRTSVVATSRSSVRGGEE